jgi:hypothetical protein
VAVVSWGDMVRRRRRGDSDGSSERIIVWVLLIPDKGMR